MKQITDDRTDRICPMFKKQCKKYWHECAFAIEKFRHYPDGTVVHVKACAVFFFADEMENHSNRLAMMQAEMGETKNAVVLHAATTLFKSEEIKRKIASLVAKTERQKMLKEANNG